jgi:hypothetical protein
MMNYAEIPIKTPVKTMSWDQNDGEKQNRTLTDQRV